MVMSLITTVILFPCRDSPTIYLRFRIISELLDASRELVVAVDFSLWNIRLLVAFARLMYWILQYVCVVSKIE